MITALILAPVVGHFAVVFSLLGQPSAAMREKHEAVDTEMSQLGA